MFKRNLLVILRTFQKFKGSFLINLVGLSTGLACTLLIYLWVTDELNFDRFHEKTGRLYQVMETHLGGKEILVDNRTAGLMAETLKDEMPEVEFSTSVISSSWFPLFVLSPDPEHHIKATGQFVSNDYFHVFSFGLIHGEASQLLTGKSDIVISDELALKLFNSTDVVGKTLTFQLLTIQQPVTVTGVFHRVPSNSSEKFDFVLPFDLFLDFSPETRNWGNNGTNTYVVLKPGTDVAPVNAKMAGMIKSRVQGTERTPFLRPYADGYLYDRFENGVQAGGRIEYVQLFSIVAVFILTIACINFMNLSTARASRRLKEVGIRKAIGASRRTLISQYIGESMLMTFLSLVIAILIVELLLPYFNEATGKQLTLVPDARLVLTLIGITLFTGLLSGSYPALYLSGFSPVAVLKGKLHTAVAEIWTRKGLVVFQFAVSVILIVVVLVVYKQIEYIQTRNPGYDKDNIVYLEVEGKLAVNTETFIQELRTLPGVAGASGMWGNLVGGYSGTGDVHWEGKKSTDRISFEIMGADYDLIELLHIRMASGRAFSREFPADTSRIIFNEAAIDAMGLDDPVGRKVTIWGKEYEIAGVAKNFHFQSLHETIKPLYITLQPKNLRVVMAKIAPGQTTTALQHIQDAYKVYNPGFPFDFKFLDQDYQAQYIAEKRVATLSGYFAGLAILISCLGLFGLAAFTAERRTKEIGIRKVLGAQELGIIYLLSGDFTKTVLLSVVIALPASYLIVRYWLDGFVFKIELQWWYFTSAGLTALLIAWLTVGIQAIKASRVNPVNSLKAE